MPKFTVCFTQDVTFSATVEVEAENEEGAYKEADKKRKSGELAWQTGDYLSDGGDLAWIQDESGEVVA